MSLNLGFLSSKQRKITNITYQTPCRSCFMITWWRNWWSWLRWTVGGTDEIRTKRKIMCRRT